VSLRIVKIKQGGPCAMGGCTVLEGYYKGEDLEIGLKWRACSEEHARCIHREILKIPPGERARLWPGKTTRGLLLI